MAIFVLNFLFELLLTHEMILIHATNYICLISSKFCHTVMQDWLKKPSTSIFRGALKLVCRRPCWHRSHDKLPTVRQTMCLCVFAAYRQRLLQCSAEGLVKSLDTVWFVSYPKLNEFHVPILIPVQLWQRNNMEQNKRKNLTFSSRPIITTSRGIIAVFCFHQLDNRKLQRTRCSSVVIAVPVPSLSNAVTRTLLTFLLQ